MFVKVNCQFCRQPFDFDSSSGLPQIDCPHCGKQNHVELPAPTPKPELTIQHGAPNLSGAKPCPDCRHQVARDASLCIHCGYNFVTGKKAGEKSWLAANLGLVLVLAGVAAAAVAGGFYLLRTEEAPLPPPPAEPAAEPAAAVPAPQDPVQEPAATHAPTEPVAAPEPPPPPAPSPEELAAQKAAAERAAFAAKKAEAERNLRLQLATREPPYKLNEPVELRRKNGLFDKGTLTGFAGAGTNRVALVATPRGEIGVPLAALDNPTRRRIDPEYREAFIRHLLSTKLPEPAGQPNQEL
jgi:hypothetical protein